MPTATLENRQHLSGSNEKERLRREADTRQLVETIVGRNGEFFAEPENRLEFMKTQDAEGFYRIAQHANARLRGEKPAVLRRDETEKGAFLMMLHTPSYEDKIPAFEEGYRAIQEYIESSEAPAEEKIKSVAMATEALVIWTHPFNDGNGRTSRFLAALIEEGATDIDSLVEQTASGNKRGRAYTDVLNTKEASLELANNNEIMLDDDEREELRAQAETLPSDVEAMYLNVQRLLTDTTIQERTLRNAPGRKVAA